MPKLADVQSLHQWRTRLSAAGAKATATITTCGGTGCQASGCLAVVEAVRKALSAAKLAGQVTLRVTGCHGFCEQGPLMVIEPGNIFYCHVKPEDAEEIVSATVGRGQVIERLLYRTADGTAVVKEADIPFYAAQDRRVLGANKRLDPTRIEDYIADGGYAALAKALTTMRPEQIIDVIEASGLRGRGGGGYPTGRKWRQCRQAEGDVKYVICNADEGDPGAYMDRSVLEGNPHSVLEGMLIGAYAIGASEGFIYVRNEYPLAVQNARAAVAEARQHGLLGPNILGTGLSFDVRIVRGAGAFVCGESTALMASLEGKVGEPRPKDVHTVEQGLWDRPSNLNNVETWANVPLILRHGPQWFASVGTAASKGTKIFALTGKVRNTGLVEVPMDTPLRKILFDIGGGPANGTAIKAVQTGGPSGGCLPAEKFDLPVDFDVLYQAGSMVGSGGMVVMDGRTCMVDVARYFLTFLQEESCGKCVPCRLGIDRMLEIVTAMGRGEGKSEDLSLLEDLGQTMSETCLCALGKTAANPVLSTLRYFREEYDAHLAGRCPAGVCRDLIRYSVDADKCTGCGACAKACPAGAVRGEKKKPHAIDAETCTRCGICRDTCRFDAVAVA